MNVRDEIKLFLEKFYECDKSMRECSFQLNRILNKEEKVMMYTGSYIEGAWCTPLMVPFEGKMLDKDKMWITCAIPETLFKFIFEETEHSGYYRVILPESHPTVFDDPQLDSDTVAEIMRIINCTQPGNYIKFDNDYHDYHDYHFRKTLFQDEWKEGRPSVCGNVRNDLMETSILKIVKSMFAATNHDNVPCIHLEFWPDIISPWFERDRHWPNQEVIDEMRSKGCHLVWKAVDYEPACWRLSFSQAEVILSKERTVFQRKCFLLAKLIFTVQTQHLIDEETERQLPSYLLKTAMNFLLEETPKEVWEILEGENNYFEVVDSLFQRLSKAFNDGFLPCFFSEEMNLLRGYSKPYLKVVSIVFSDFFKTNDGLTVTLESFRESAICRIENQLEIDFSATNKAVCQLMEDHLPEIEQEILEFQSQDNVTADGLNELFLKVLEKAGIYQPSFSTRLYRTVTNFFNSNINRLDRWTDNLIEGLFDNAIINFIDRQ